MSLRNPLLPSEVPPQYRQWFDFEQQFMKPRPGGTRGDSAIITKCKDCVNSFTMLISSVRNTLKRGGRLLGLCEACKVDRKWLTEDLYVMMYKPKHANARADGKILEHIYVMSEHLGRPLEGHEQVHHRDGDRQNNSIINLELWSTFQPSGQRIEDKLVWAKAIIDLYPVEWKTLND